MRWNGPMNSAFVPCGSSWLNTIMSPTCSTSTANSAVSTPRNLPHTYSERRRTREPARREACAAHEHEHRQREHERRPEVVHEVERPDELGVRAVRQQLVEHDHESDVQHEHREQRREHAEELAPYVFRGPAYA